MSLQLEGLGRDFAALPAKSRRLAIHIAWWGFLEEGYLGPILLGIGGLMLALKGADSVQESDSAGAESWGLVVLGLLVIGGAVFWAWAKWKENRKTLELQKLGDGFLRGFYDTVRSRGDASMKLAMEKLVGTDAIVHAECDVIEVPNPRHLEAGSSGFVPPTFTRPMNVEMVGYFLSARGLAIVPAPHAELKDQRTKRPEGSVITKPRPVLDMYATAALVVDPGDERQRIVFHHLDGLSAAELYFSEMVMAEYSGSDEQIGELKITTRDGRNFALRAHAPLAAAVREALRRSKTTPAASAGVASAGPTKVCPACAESVQGAARICRYCRFEFAP